MNDYYKKFLKFAKYLLIVSVIVLIISLIYNFIVYAADTYKCTNPSCSHYNQTVTPRTENFATGASGDRIRTKYYCPFCNTEIGSSTISGISGETTDDRNRNLYTDEELLNMHVFFKNWLYVIFGIENAESDDVNVFNTRAIMEELTNNMQNAVNNFTGNSLYIAFRAIGVFLLIISFVFSFYNTSLNSEGKTMQQYARLIIQFIIAIYLVMNVHEIANLILSIFKYTMTKAWEFADADSAMGNEMKEKVDEIFIKLLRAAKADSKDPLAFFFNMFPMLILHIQFLIPWLVSLVGKFGLMFAVVKTEINIFVNIVLYPIAAHDCFENIKQSSFMKYTKKIAAASLELTIIVIVMIASNNMLIEYIKNKMATINENNTFNVGMMAAVFSLAKMVAANSLSSSISNSVFGG